MRAFTLFDKALPFDYHILSIALQIEINVLTLADYGDMLVQNK